MTKNKLQVKDGNIGTFEFNVKLIGMGVTAEEAWEDVRDSILGSREGIGGMPVQKNIKLIEEVEM